MHKCTNCGQEFDGKFCPECGAERQDVKACPVCGARLYGGVKFCPECGYSFTDAKPQPSAELKQRTGFKQKMSAVWGWIKAHLKIVIPSACGLVVLIVMLSLIPTFIAVPSNGTYYGYRGGEYDTSSYITLKNYKWKDDVGESGKYKLSGKKITLTASFMGETETFKGTVKNGVLSLDMDGDGEIDEIYVRKNHKHKYGGWTTDYEATCTSEGRESRSCGCGFNDKREIQAFGHTVTDAEWSYDYDQHWKICSVCGDKIGEEHSGDTKCLICTVPLTDTEGLKYSLNDDGTGYDVGRGSDKNYGIVRIPKNYEGLPVTGIASYAFQQDEFKGIIIPDSVTYIGYHAFYDCSRLTSVTIPDSVIEIDYSAFERCTGLTRVTIGDGVSSIGRYAFDRCSSLVYNEYDNAKYLGNGGNPYLALIEAKDTSVTSCNINESTKVIASGAFYCCSGLTSVTIPDSVTSVGENVFNGCGSLTSITIGNGMTYIGEHTFDGCTGLTGITIPENITSIGRYAFYDCSNLTSIIIPDSVTKIGEDAFWNCTGLTSIIIPNNVTYIGNQAFYGCTGLTSVTLGNSVAEISQFAFSGCGNITTATIPAWATYCIPKTNLQTVVITSGETTVNSYAFLECSNLTSVTVPDSVTYIAEGAFKYCGSLTNIDFKGTKAQWNAIEKDSGWNNNTGDYTVQCTDGKLDKDGNEIE